MEYIQSLSQLKSNFKEALISLHFVLISDHIFSLLFAQTLPYPAALGFWTLIKFNSTPKVNIHFILALIFSLFPSMPGNLSAKNRCRSIRRVFVCFDVRAWGVVCVRDRDASDFASCWSGMQTHLIYQRIGQLRPSREWAVVQETKWMFHWLAAFAYSQSLMSSCAAVSWGLLSTPFRGAKVRVSAWRWHRPVITFPSPQRHQDVIQKNEARLAPATFPAAWKTRIPNLQEMGSFHWGMALNER